MYNNSACNSNRQTYIVSYTPNADDGPRLLLMDVRFDYSHEYMHGGMIKFTTKSISFSDVKFYAFC